MQTNVVEWLESSAAKYPNKIALSDQNETLTYKEYHDKALGIGREICRKNIGAKKPIVVYLEKSVKVVVSFLGIAYSGNFYSPIDIDMPRERIQKILETLEPEIVITSRVLKSNFDNINYKCDYIIYEDTEKTEDDEEIDKLLQKCIDTDLLYVLFTSGSTGIPKGVCITNRGVIDYTNWLTETFDITDKDNFGNQAPFYFDNSITDIYGCLKTGATLYIIPKNLFAQPVNLLRFLKDNKITTILWVPSAMMVVSKLNALKSVDLNNTLRNVLFAGEVMPNKQLNIWRKYLPNCLFANMYGPTEITDICTYYVVNREFSDDEPLPIGIPCKNKDVIVLDDNGNIVTKPHIKGELCIRGSGVSFGYYNNSNKTESVFVNNPLNRMYDEKIYKSGDYVEYNDYDEIMYLSRKDFQIKHMGHRIELGEIETAASSLTGVTQCCCLYDEDRSKIVLFIDKDIEIDEIKKELSNMIPDYMVPGRVVYIEKMPLNANGKIDRLKLKQYI